ncbi:MAG: hypothetical protein NVS1B3_03370 [Candidatus Dormibacteraceae bacterium]
MVLADPKYIEPNLVGQLHLLHEVSHPLSRWDATAAIGADPEVGKRVNAKLHQEGALEMRRRIDPA